ncbi:MAG: hypothetical protein ACLQJR_30055 [Stellaceae bacterium]
MTGSTAALRRMAAVTRRAWPLIETLSMRMIVAAIVLDPLKPAASAFFTNDAHRVPRATARLAADERTHRPELSSA